ncbi:MAG: TRAP transporter small permease [Eubacteriales bacterium]|jgi:TRAP-type C4-dicarboxylate transport system permease small subunit
MKKLLWFLCNKAEEVVLAFIVGAMGLIMLLQVFFRYVLQTPLVWSEESVRFLFIWLTFIGISYTVKMKTYTTVELLSSKFSPGVQKILKISCNVLAMIFFAILFLPAMEVMNGQRGIMSTGVKVDMSWVYLSVPVGIVLAEIRLLQHTWQLITGKEEK